MASAKVASIAQHPPDEHTGSRSTALRGDALRDSAPVSNKEATTQHPSPGEARLPSGIESPQRRRSYDEHTDSRSTGLGGDALGDGALARNEEATTQHPSPGESRLPSETRKTSGIDIEKLALMRYNSAWSVANPASVYVHLSLALLFMTLFIIGVSVASGLTAPGRYYCWIPAGLSRIQANLLFDVVLTTAVGFLSKFWTSLSIFVAHTEPLAQMARPCGGPAKHTLLLNYTFSFLPVRIYNAFRNKHWKLVRVVIWGLIQRFFPTLVGSSITVYSVGLEESDDRCVVCFSMPLFVVIIVGFAACAGFIVYELLLASVFRRTPRDYLSIADIVSWSSTSSLLHPTATDIAQEESPLVDPLHVEVEGEKGKRWYMQYRLELQLDHFRLGYAKVPDREYYAFGITDEEPERLPVVRPTRLARRLVADSESGKEKGLAKKLEVVIGNGSISYVKLVSASENTGVTYLNATVPKGNYQDEEGQPDQNN
ncbi:hypothetical protein CTA2_10313 [Colletotrichum tanaceti]|uniref:Uncharacterized protein n=1 Tax=Colletotrichum tanaceti TaxID=1306861 RepID=A0A4U6XDH3_9PEZI|nr:hypothetical protein CTA2_10313 [Colletotrichum tanaceti]TKW53494.1 hypothetical protein CTA1_12390 [Colletotrichum tanaceti]